MKIKIKSSGIDIDNIISTYINRRVELALGRFSSRVRRVHVTLIDENQPSKYMDQKCILHISLIGIPSIVIEQEDIDIYKAIDNSVDSAVRAVSRIIDRDTTSYSRRVQTIIIKKGISDG